MMYDSFILQSPSSPQRNYMTVYQYMTMKMNIVIATIRVHYRTEE
jgi:hypothetical protein